MLPSHRSSHCTQEPGLYQLTKICTFFSPPKYDVILLKKTLSLKHILKMTLKNPSWLIKVLLLKLLNTFKVCAQYLSTHSVWSEPRLLDLVCRLATDIFSLPCCCFWSHRIARILKWMISKDFHFIRLLVDNLPSPLLPPFPLPYTLKMIRRLQVLVSVKNAILKALKTNFLSSREDAVFTFWIEAYLIYIPNFSAVLSKQKTTMFSLQVTKDMILIKQ